MKANPRYAHFFSVLVADYAKWLAPWEGDCWRYQDVEFPSAKEVLSGEGARQNGGRLNTIGSFPVVYGSSAEKTALDESAARARRYGLTVRKPRILVCIEMKLQKVIDLRNEPLLRALGLTLAELGAEDWETLQSNGTESMGQSLGRATFDTGVEGVLIPSFAHPEGLNIAWFPPNHVHGSVVRIVGGDKLPVGKAKKKRK